MGKLECVQQKFPYRAKNQSPLLGTAMSMVLLTQPAMVFGDVPFVRDGEAGFVVSDIKFALGPDAEGSGICPSGMTKNVVDIFALTPEGKRAPEESEEEYNKRLERSARKLATGPDGKNLCMNPEVGEPDPHFHTVEVSDVPVGGIDLDGENSFDDFPGVNGEVGVDNQFFRVVGCNHSFQSTGSSNTFAIEMLTGSWGILLTLADLDDIQNDDYVEVGLYANADPIRLSSSREPLHYATYARDQDPDYQATTSGRIKDGILTTNPVDVQFHYVVNSIILERDLRDARIKATLSEEGLLEGYLSGYTPVEAMYDAHFGFRNGKTTTGEEAPIGLRLGSSNGAAYVLGYTCHGVYHALYQHADGHPDPDTGRFTSISTQYEFQAVPAFVVK